MLAVLRNTLYIYGGIYERGAREYTLDDFYSLQLDKLDKFVCLKESKVVPDLANPDADESDEEDDDEEDGDDDDDDDDDSEVEDDDYGFGVEGEEEVEDEDGAELEPSVFSSGKGKKSAFPKPVKLVDGDNEVTSSLPSLSKAY